MSSYEIWKHLPAGTLPFPLAKDLLNYNKRHELGVTVRGGTGNANFVGRTRLTQDASVAIVPHEDLPLDNRMSYGDLIRSMPSCGIKPCSMAAAMHLIWHHHPEVGYEKDLYFALTVNAIGASKNQLMGPPGWMGFRAISIGSETFTDEVFDWQGHSWVCELDL